MPAKRELTMRQLRQMLRLRHDGVGAREIGRTLGVARSTIQDNIERAKKAGLTWPLPPDLSDDILEQRLFSKASYVLIGRGAVLHHDFPELVRQNPHFESVALPVTRDYLRREGLSPVFIEYMNNWKGFVAAEG